MTDSVQLFGGFADDVRELSAALRPRHGEQTSSAEPDVISWRLRSEPRAHVHSS